MVVPVEPWSPSPVCVVVVVPVVVPVWPESCLSPWPPSGLIPVRTSPSLPCAWQAIMRCMPSLSFATEVIAWLGTVHVRVALFEATVIEPDGFAVSVPLSVFA